MPVDRTAPRRAERSAHLSPQVPRNQSTSEHARRIRSFAPFPEAGRSWGPRSGMPVPATITMAWGEVLQAQAVSGKRRTASSDNRGSVRLAVASESLDKLTTARLIPA